MRVESSTWITFDITAALMCVVLLEMPAAAEEADRLVTAAQVHDQRATALFEAGDFADALEEMEAAELVLPSTPRLYNMARCHERLDQPREAIELYERFLAAEDVPPDRRNAVEERLRNLQEQLSSQETDDESQPPSEPQIETSPPSASSSFQGSPAEDSEVAPIDEGSPAAVAEEEETGPRRLSPAAFYSVLGIAAATGVALAALGAVTLGEHEEFLELDINDPNAPADAARGNRLTLATNVLLGATCVTAAAAVVLAIFTRWNQRDQARLEVTAGPLRDGASITVFRRF